MNTTTEIEIEAEIMDCEGNLIGTFKGYGKQKVFCAAYYGYRGGGEPGYNFAASRKSNIEATKKAMKEIKVKIKSQKNELENLLIICKR